MHVADLLEGARGLGISRGELVALLILLAGATCLTWVMWTGQQGTVPAGEQATSIDIQTADEPVADRAASGATPVGSSPTTGPRSSAGAQPATVVVDVAGLVQRPGVVELPAGARVADALARAGGALPGADTSGLNLARLLQDGEQVLVADPAEARPPAGVGLDGPPLTADGRLDLNRASESDLLELPGVGPVTAGRIVTARDERGGFRDLVELLEVPGIGPARFADLEPLVGL